MLGVQFEHILLEHCMAEYCAQFHFYDYYLEIPENIVHRYSVKMTIRNQSGDQSSIRGTLNGFSGHIIDTNSYVSYIFGAECKIQAHISSILRFELPYPLPIYRPLALIKENVPTQKYPCSRYDYLQNLHSCLFH